MTDLTYTLDEINTACEDATDGPWMMGDDRCVRSPDRDIIWDNSLMDWPDMSNGAFIAMARTALPELAAEVERLRADYAEAQETYAALHASWEAAEATIQRVRALVEDWEAIGPGTPFENVMGQQSVTIETATRLIRAAIDGEADRD